MRSASLLAASVWLSAALALPAVFNRETCVCEPLERTYEPVSPPLSCVRTAAEISNWRALSFHRPELADKFVDMSALGAPKPPPKAALVGSASRGIRKSGHCIANRIKLALRVLRHGDLSPRAEQSSLVPEKVSHPVSQLQNFHLRIPHRLSTSSSQSQDIQSDKPVRTSSAFSDEKRRRWKVVCYAQDRKDIPHTFHSTILAFMPFFFILAFIASLRLQVNESPEDEKS